jgi:N-acetylmuramoyl-L-alanine amidase
MPRIISVILSCVRRVLIFAGLFSLVAASLTLHLGVAAQKPQTSQSQTQKQSPQQNPAQSPGQAATQTPPQTPQSAQTLRTVVLDPGHGGEDTGARGPTGVAEKDIVLDLAQTVASSLRTQGFQVVLTRFGDTDPSLDDRAAVANAQTNAIFISLHVGSSGELRTVRTYTYLFATTVQSAPGHMSVGNATESLSPAVPPQGFLLWREAQRPFLAQSQKLGDLIQVELAQKFKGSPEISRSVPVAVLGSVAAPAAAIEISSIAADQQQLEEMGSDLAYSITRAVTAYKTIYPPGGKP